MVDNKANLQDVMGWSISAAMKKPDYRALMFKMLEVEDFTGPEKTIFQAFIDACEGGRFDALAMISAVERTSAIKRMEEIENDYRSHTDELSYRGWLKTIREASEGRAITGALARAGARLAAGDKADTVLSELLAEVGRARERGRGETMVPLREGVRMVRESMADWGKGKPDVETVPTGYSIVDRRLGGGLVRKHITVLGGRPGQGKTQLALEVMRRVAQWGKGQQREAAVIMFSAEMTLRSLTERMASSVAGVSTGDLKAGRGDEYDYKAYTDALNLLDSIGDRFVVDETPDPTTAQMLARVAVEAMAHKDGIDLVVFDYIELAGEAQGKNTTGDDRIGRIMRGLKIIAKRYNCPVLALSQLNREVESRSSRMPELSDLRASGWVENLAQTVVFIMRPDYYAAKLDSGRMEYQTEAIAALAKRHGENACILDVAKNRDGGTGIVVLRFQGECTRISEDEKQEVARTVLGQNTH